MTHVFIALALVVIVGALALVAVVGSVVIRYALGASVSRLRARAASSIGEARVATLRGIARGVGRRLESPLARRPCLAYVALRPPGEQLSAASRFVLCVGDDTVLVEATAVRVLAEMPRRGVTRFEAVLVDGDEVVVRGELRRIDRRVAGALTAAIRPTFRLVGTWERPVTLVMPEEKRGELAATLGAAGKGLIARLVARVRTAASELEATVRRIGRNSGPMSHMKPVIVVPRTAQVSQMLEARQLTADARAQSVGIAVIAPRTMRPAELMVACHFWPRVLREAQVTRVAVVLGVESYVLARPVLAACQYRMKEQGIAIEYFHEAHLDTDQIRAWFENRRPRKRVSTDTLVRLSERYAARGDVRAAQHALRIAEAAAAA